MPTPDTERCGGTGLLPHEGTPPPGFSIPAPESKPCPGCPDCRCPTCKGTRDEPRVVVPHEAWAGGAVRVTRYGAKRLCDDSFHGPASADPGDGADGSPASTQTVQSADPDSQNPSDTATDLITADPGDEERGELRCEVCGVPESDALSLPNVQCEYGHTWPASPGASGGERWRRTIAICAECDEPIGPDREGCRCDPRDYYDDVRRVQGEPGTVDIEVVPASALAAAQQARNDAIESARRADESWEKAEARADTLQQQLEARDRDIKELGSRVGGLQQRLDGLCGALNRYFYTLDRGEFANENEVRVALDFAQGQGE